MPFCVLELMSFIILVFVQARQPLKAMEAYEKALNWQELFEVALTNGVSEEDVTAMGYRVAGMLRLHVPLLSTSFVYL